MNGLKLQTPVKEVKPLWAINIHGGSEHLLWEGFVDPKVCGAHGEMAERNLYMQRSCDHVADHDKRESASSGGDRLVDYFVAKPVPEEDLAGYLKPPMPPCRAFLGPLAHDKVFPAQTV